MPPNIDWIGGYAEASQYLSISERRLRRAVAERKIDHCKPNGFRVAFTRAQLDAYIERFTVTAVV